jgi:hypothetical protein
VFPKQGSFLPTKIALKMPQVGDEVLVGAQFTSTETEKQEYLWKIVNENGMPKTLFIKNPPELK